MSDADVLIQAELDLSNIDPQIDNLKRKFEELSQTSLKFGNFNRSIRDMTTNINVATQAFNDFSNAVARVMGTGTIAVDNAAQATRRAATEAKNAASAQADHARATEKLAQAQLSQANAEDKISKARETRTRTASRGPQQTGGLLDTLPSQDYSRELEARYDRIRKANDSYSRDLEREQARISAEVNKHSGQTTPQYFSNNDWRSEAAADAKGFNAYEDAEPQRRRQTMRGLRDQVNNAGGASAFMKSTGTSSSSFGGMRTEIEGMGMQLKAFPSFFDKMASSSGRILQMWAEWSLITGAVEVSIQAITESITKASELQVQGVLFNASQRSAGSIGMKTDGATSGQFSEASIVLAKRWGDEVNDVAQNLQLWYKRTGDLNGAMALTEDELKFQLATGTQLEDTYRTLTGLAAQASDQPLMAGGKNGTTLADTPRILEMITSAALAMGAGLHVAGRSGNELFSDTQEASSMLMSGLDKDDAALAKLGLSLEQAIQLNAGLTQAFGNTGSASSEAADKVQRIVGGIEKLGNPAEVSTLAKDGIDVGSLKTALTPGHGDVIENLDGVYKKLTITQQEFFSEFLTGTRNVDALEAVFREYENNLVAIHKSTKDLTAEDKLAADMHDTLRNKIQTLEASWEALLVTAGTTFLPILSVIVDFIRDSVIPAFLDMGRSIALALGGAAAGFAMGGPVGALLGGAVGGGVGALMDHQASPQGQLEAINNRLNAGGRYTARGPERDSLEAQRSHLAHYVPATERNNRFGKPEAVPGFWEVNAGQSAGAQSAKGSDFIAEVKKRQLAYEALLKKEFPGKPVTQNTHSLVADPKASGSGVVKDYQSFSGVLANLNEQFRSKNELQSAELSSDKAVIAYTEQKISLYGISATSLHELSEAEGNYGSALDRTAATLKSQESIYANKAAQANKHVKRDSKGNVMAPHSTEDEGWLRTYNDAESKLISVRTQLQKIKTDHLTIAAEMERYNQQWSEAQAKIAATSEAAVFKGLQGRFSSANSYSGKSGIADQMQDAAYSDFAGSLKTNAKLYGSGTAKGIEADQKAADLFNERVTAIGEGMKNWVFAANATADAISKATTGANFDLLETLAKGGHNGAGNPGSTNQLRYSRDISDIQEKASAFSKEPGADQAAIKGWQDVADANALANYQLETYKDKLQHLESTPLFAGLTAAFKTLGDTLDKDLVDIVNGTHAATEAISNLQTQIQNVKNLQTTGNFYYSGETTHSAMDSANQALTNYNYNAEQGALTQQEQAQQYKLNNPSLLSQVGSSFMASALGGLTSQLSSVGLGSIANSLVGGLGGGTGNATTELAATNQNTTALSQNTLALGKVSNGINGGGGSSGGLTGLLGSLGGGSLAGPLGVGAALLGATASGGTNGLMGGLVGGGLVAGGLAAAGATAGGAALLTGGAGISGAGLMPVLAAMGPVGWGLLAAGVIGGGAIASGALGPHYSSQSNPDMPQFASSGYNGLMANAFGSGTYGGGSPTAEDPTMQQALGGDTQLQYLDSFYNSHPGGQGLTGSSLSLWQQIGGATGGGTATGATSLHDGNVTIGNASGQTVSSGAWSDLLNNLNNLTQSTYTFNSALNQATSQMMTVINQYGGSSGFYPYAGAIPGYGAPANPANPTNNALNPNGLPTAGPGAVTGVMGAATNPINASGIRASGSGVVVTSIQVDGRQLARSVQSYTAQANNAGHAFVS